jgi:hypothetical protein
MREGEGQGQGIACGLECWVRASTFQQRQLKLTAPNQWLKSRALQRCQKADWGHQSVRLQEQRDRYQVVAIQQIRGFGIGQQRDEVRMQPHCSLRARGGSSHARATW